MEDGKHKIIDERVRVALSDHPWPWVTGKMEGGREGGLQGDDIIGRRYLVMWWRRGRGSATPVDI